MVAGHVGSRRVCCKKEHHTVSLCVMIFGCLLGALGDESDMLGWSLLKKCMRVCMYICVYVCRERDGESVCPRVSVFVCVCV